MSMKTTERQLLALGRKKLFRAKDLDSLGIARVYLKRLVDEEKLWRAGRGLYRAADSPIEAHQSLAEVASRYPKGIVCLLSALRFHELTTENPSEVYLMMPIHSQCPRMENQALRVFWTSGKAYSAGVEEHIIGGVPVKITSPAKTVIDCFKFRRKIGVNVAVEALQEAWRRKRVTANDLSTNATICRMSRVMRPYFEMLVA